MVFDCLVFFESLYSYLGIWYIGCEIFVKESVAWTWGQSDEGVPCSLSMILRRFPSDIALLIVVFLHLVRCIQP